MQIEADAIARALRLAFDSSRTRASGRVDGRDVELRTIGLRGSQLDSDELQAFDVVALAGLSGGLDPALRVGDVVVDETSPLVPLPPYRRVRAHTATDAVMTPADKAALFASTGAAVVDMETGVVAAAARRANVPLINIRAVSDAAGDTIDPAVLTLVDPRGRPRLLAAARLLLHRPSMLGELLRLRRNARLATANLARAVRRVLESYPVEPARGG